MIYSEPWKQKTDKKKEMIKQQSEFHNNKLKHCKQSNGKRKYWNGNGKIGKTFQWKPQEIKKKKRRG